MRESKSYKDLIEQIWQENVEEAVLQFKNWCWNEWKEAIRRKNDGKGKSIL